MVLESNKILQVGLTTRKHPLTNTHTALITGQLIKYF